MKVTHPMSKVKYILHWLRGAKGSERSDYSSFLILHFGKAVTLHV